MGKKTLCIAVIIILVGLLMSISKADNPIKIDSKIYKTLDKSNQVNVIIKFKDTSSKGIQNQVTNIGKDKVKHEFLNDKIISAKLNLEDIDKLKNNANIESIQEDGIKHVFLQDSVPLINATLTWKTQVNSINLTGIGETICIIDTGVNYSNPDLGGCYGNNNASSSCKIIGGYDFVNNDNNPMDDNGHGTHVSGIIAANGNITGVAPGAKIVMMKVCDSGGGCADSDIKAGIDWCVGNSSLYNISVISMSLGGGLYNSYCDNIDDPANITSSINNAVGKNISVIIAAGNGLNNIGAGNYTAIASPACIQNATAVSATYKNDSIDSRYADRNSLVKLVAPGTNINSTWLSGYAVETGTSMAAPHVAAAFAILHQVGKLQNSSLKTSEILSALQATGLQINDSGSGLNFSRINIYAAVQNLTIHSLAISVNSPINNSWNNALNFNISTNEEVYCWAVFNSSNITLGENTSFTYFNSTIAESSTNITYNVTFYCNNSLNITNSSTEIFFGIDQTAPIMHLFSPDNAYSTTTTSITFSYNITENNSISNCSLIIDNTIDQTNNTIISNVNSTFTKTFSTGTYTWNVNCTDYAGNQNSSESRTLTITSSTPPPGGGGGGGGGSSSSTTTKNTTNTTINITENKTQNLTKENNITIVNKTITQQKSKITFAVIKEGYQKIIGEKYTGVMLGIIAVAVIFIIIKIINKFKRKRRHNRVW